MTREEWKERLPLIQAFVEGKRVENSNENCTEWAAYDNLNFIGSSRYYRIAPEPKLRPWTAEEVPHLARIREKGPTTKQSFYSTILAVKNDCEVMCLNGWYTTGYLLDHCEHSTDGGKTWNPCGVVEGER